MKENNTIEEESLILAPVNRTQGKWIAENSAIIKMVNPAGSFDNGKLIIAQCYSTIEGNSFEYKHLHPEIEKAFEENPLLIEKVITDKMAKANAEFICEAVNNYDKLKAANSLLLEALKGLADILNQAANSLESQARRAHTFNTLVEPLREYSEAIKKAGSK